MTTISEEEPTLVLTDLFKAQKDLAKKVLKEYLDREPTPEEIKKLRHYSKAGGICDLRYEKVLIGKIETKFMRKAPCFKLSVIPVEK